MRARLVMVAVMALFLLAGAVSSSACEMMCMPGMQHSACCAHSVARCVKGAFVVSAPECSHPLQEVALLSATTPAQQLQALAVTDAGTTTPQYAAMQAISHASAHGGLARSSLIPPLRI